MIHTKSVITIAAIAAFPALFIFTNGNILKPKNGVVLKIESKAAGFFNDNNVSWTLGKFKDPGSAQILIGQSANFNYTISAGKTLGSPPDQKGAFGQVCITNTGSQAASGLKITNQVQYKTKGSFKDVDGALQTQTPDALAPGANTCVDFRIVFTPPQNSELRVKSSVSFTGSNGREVITKDTAGFSIPQSSQNSPTEATITDTLECPTGYSCIPSDSGPWQVSDTATITYNVLVKNDSANCAEPVSLVNYAVLEDASSGTKLSSGESATLNSPPC